MPTNFTRPTAAEILARIKTDIEGALSGVSARLRNTFELGVAKAQAGVSHALHGHLAWVAEQIIADTAAEAFLVRWGALFGVDRVAAAPAVGFLAVTGTGGTIPAGAEFIRAADGQAFTADATTVGVTATTIAVTAVVAGQAGNLEIGEAVSLSSPIANVDSAATTTAAFSSGADLESLADLLERVLLRMQTPPMGGAPGDHETWALEVAGVTRAWEYPRVGSTGNPGLGKVALIFVRDSDASLIPDSGEVAAVQAYLDARSPAEVFVVAPTAVAFDYSVTLDPSNATVEAAVEAEVADMLAREAEPGGTLSLSRLNEAISAAAGEVSHTLNSPTTDTVYAFGVIATYGTATFS